MAIISGGKSLRTQENTPIIINGNMLIAQRGTSGTAVAGGSYLACDRWKAWEASDAAVTVSQETDGPTGQFNKCLKYNVTTADSSIGAAQFGMVRQMIEGHNIINLGFGTASAQAVTLSFWVKSSLTGSHGGALNNGNEDRSYPFAYTISSANTWTYICVNIPGDTTGTWDTDNTAGMIVTFGLGAGSDYQGTAAEWQAGNKFQPSSTVQTIGTVSNWNVTGVQLEIGTFTATTAPTLQFESFGDNLARCQRYYEIVADVAETSDSAICYMCGGFSTKSDQVNWNSFFAVKKRAAFTLEATTGTDYYKAVNHGEAIVDTEVGMTAAYQPLNCVNGYITGSYSGSTVGKAWQFTLNNASAKIACSAEL